MHLDSEQAKPYGGLEVGLVGLVGCSIVLQSKRRRRLANEYTRTAVYLLAALQFPTVSYTHESKLYADSMPTFAHLGTSVSSAAARQMAVWSRVQCTLSKTIAWRCSCSAWLWRSLNQLLDLGRVVTRPTVIILIILPLSAHLTLALVSAGVCCTHARRRPTCAHINGPVFRTTPLIVWFIIR